MIADALSRANPPDSATPTKFQEELASLIDDEQSAEVRTVASADSLKRIQQTTGEYDTYMYTSETADCSGLTCGYNQAATVPTVC